MLKNLKDTTLLFVEDDDILRKQYSYVFRQFFLKVIEARSAIEGLEFYEKNSVQCIVSDIVMDDMNGIELIQEIRKTNKNIPIILFSSHPTQKYLLESITLNLSDFLIKPASFQDIKNVLTKCAYKMIDEQLIAIKLDDEITYYPLTKTLVSLKHEDTLTKKESLLLELLINNSKKIISKEVIEDVVYFDSEMSDSALKNLLFKLRKKLHNQLITTIAGQGFMLK